MPPRSKTSNRWLLVLHILIDKIGIILLDGIKEIFSLEAFILNGENLSFVYLTFVNHLTPFTDISFFIKYLFLGAYMISLFVIEHIAGGNLFYGLFQECTLRKNEMDVIVGFPLIVMQGCDTIRSVSLSEMVCKYLQQFVWRILRKRFRQGYDQFPCLNTFPLRTAFFKFCMITFCKVTPERLRSVVSYTAYRFSCFLGLEI